MMFRMSSRGGKKEVDGSILVATVRRPRKPRLDGLRGSDSVRPSWSDRVRKEIDKQVGGRIVRRPQPGSESDRGSGASFVLYN